MNNNAILKRMLKPGLLIISSIILFTKNYFGLGIIVFIIYLVDNFYQLNYFWKKENDLQKFVKSIDNGLSENVLQFIYPLAEYGITIYLILLNQRMN